MLEIRINSKHANSVLNYEPHGIKNRQASSINAEASKALSVISYRREVTLEWLSGFCKDAHKLHSFMDFLLTRDFHRVYYLLFTTINFH